VYDCSNKNKKIKQVLFFKPKLEVSLMYKKRIAIKVKINPITIEPVSPMNILNFLDKLYLPKPIKTANVLTAYIPIP